MPYSSHGNLCRRRHKYALIAELNLKFNSRFLRQKKRLRNGDIMQEKKKGWLQTLLGYAGSYRKKFGLSIVLSIISITAGLVPFFCMYQIICQFVEETVTKGGYSYLVWYRTARLLCEGSLLRRLHWCFPPGCLSRTGRTPPETGRPFPACAVGGCTVPLHR